MSESANELYKNLMEIENVLVDIINKTEVVLQKAGVDFSMAELHIKNIIGAIK